MNLEAVFRELTEAIPNEQVMRNVSMKKHTSFRIGGPADIMVIPSTKEQIKNTLYICDRYNVPVTIMGNGSNLLVSDKGIRGVVIKIAERFTFVTVEGVYVKAQAGVLLSALSSVILKSSLAGFEFASGIPGTLGGAVVMNAGAYGGEIKDVVEEVVVLDEDYNELVLTNDDLNFGYRKSIIQEKSYIVLEVKLKLRKGDYNKSKELISELTRRRRDKQPLSYPSAGSAFKRPTGYYAGKLIQDAGLRGFRVGDAQVSELHTGFIINLGNATAQDVITLINIIKDKVYEKFGVKLNPEIRIIGEE